MDYEDDPEFSRHVPEWKKIVRQYGGEVEVAYNPQRLTHVLCRTQVKLIEAQFDGLCLTPLSLPCPQDSPIAQQGLREGKRLITVHWFNDIIQQKKVSPPWKAVHFPLPPK